MNSAVKRILELLHVLAEPGGLCYLTTAGRPSFASFRISRALKAHCGAVRTIIDVGANRGQFAIASRFFFPKASLVAFEPIPELAAALRRKLARRERMVVECLAVGMEPGRARFNVSKYDHASSLLRATPRNLKECPGAQASRTIETDVTTLDRYFGGHTVEGPVLLKLDVQGYESSVLAGGGEFLKCVDYLVYESSFEQMYEGEKVFGEMYDLARQLGFELVGPVDFWRGASGKVTQVDLLWQRRQD